MPSSWQDAQEVACHLVIAIRLSYGRHHDIKLNFRIFSSRYFLQESGLSLSGLFKATILDNLVTGIGWTFDRHLGYIYRD